MGVIQRQGFKAGLWMYSGVLLGFLNGMILYPRILGTEVYGYIQWLFATVMVLSSFSGLGIKAGLVRYFPAFRNSENGHEGFLSINLLIANAGLLLTLLILWLGQDVFMSVFRSPENEKYLKANYWLLPALLVLIVYFDVLSAYLAALLRPSITQFFKDLVARLITTLLILLFYWGIITEELFIQLIVGKQLLLILASYWYLRRMGEWKLRINWSAFPRAKLLEMGNYNLFNLLSGVGSQLINRIDSIMIPAILTFSENGIYSIYYFITTIIIMPYEAVRQIVTPLIAEAWNQNDQQQIKTIYRRTARAATAVALLIFIGIAANLDNAVLLIGPEIATGKMVAIWLGLGQLTYCVSGYNVTILSLSERFRWDLLVKFLSVVLTITTNYFFIHAYGIVGAAIATATTIVLTNGVYQYLIWRYFRMHPFSWQLVGLLFLAVLVFGGQYFWPPLPAHFLVDIVVRSLAITVAFVGSVWLFNLVPELRDAVKNLPFWKD